MAELESRHGQSILVRPNQPLTGIPLMVNGEAVVQYFTDEEGVEKASTSANLQRALGLAGAWKDLGDWNDVLNELDRIRHDSKPTPPIDP